MASLTEYFDGVVLTPLHLLTSDDDFAECPSAFSDGAAENHFQQYLNNPTAPITGIVTPEQMLEMLRAIGVTLARFRETRQTPRTPLLNETVQVSCLVGRECLSKARQKLGNNFHCLVKLYCVPTAPSGGYSNGQILRQILLHRHDAAIADSWLARLPEGMQRHVRMLMDHPGIWAAMREVAKFPGLWEDVKIGNFAKHLAAHIDEAIEYYWTRLARIWSDFFKGLEAQIPMIDVEDVRFLQFKAPKKSKKDRELIFRSLDSKSLFRNINDENDRALLCRNLVQHDIVIPSILAFHENVRYLTIGLKILEREILPPSRPVRRKTLKKHTNCVITQLKKQWTQPASSNRSSTSGTAALRLLKIALTQFHCLSNEAPLQDTKDYALLAGPCEFHIAMLCDTASSIGFNNTRIQERLNSARNSNPKCNCYPIRKRVSRTPSKWRGGKPTVNAYLDLQMQDAGENNDQRIPVACKPSWVQLELISAFFTQKPDPSHSTEQSSNTGSSTVPSLPAREIEMSDQMPSTLPTQQKTVEQGEKLRKANQKRKAPLMDTPVPGNSAIRRTAQTPRLNAEPKRLQKPGPQLTNILETMATSRAANEPNIPMRDSVRSIPMIDSEMTISRAPEQQNFATQPQNIMAPPNLTAEVMDQNQSRAVRSGNEARARRMRATSHVVQERDVASNSQHTAQQVEENGDLVIPDIYEDERRSNPDIPY